MTRGKSSRSKAKARPSQLWHWWPAFAIALVFGGALSFYLLDIATTPEPPLARLEIPIDTAPPNVEAATAVDATSSMAGPPEIQVARESKDARLPPPPAPKGKLSLFHDALAKLEAGTMAEPVTVLHLGDSHIASDRITGEVRHLLQARFGDAGRGMMMPGFPFPYYKAPGFTFEKSGTWEAANSLTDEGVYGIAGVNLTTASADASLKLVSTSGPFASAEVSLLAAPGNGSAVIAAGNFRQEVATSAEKRSVLRVKVPANASSLEIKIAGNGPVTVLGWSAWSDHPGIRYVNLGIPGASALTTSRFDPALAASDIADIAPKLVILGYGTNEGFNDDLNLAEYQASYERLIDLVKQAAPDASLIILGPIDGARAPRGVRGEKRAALPCRPLSDGERAGYDELRANDDKGLARWHTPPKLEAVRSLLARIAGRHGAVYWDLSRIMGGPCSIDRWAKAKPPLALPDHIHLSDEGSKRIGRAIYEALIAGYDKHRQASAAEPPFNFERAPARVAGR